METEYHRQLPCVTAGVPVTVLNGRAGHLSHGYDLSVCPECHVVEFFQIFVDVRAVRVIFPPVACGIIPEFTLADQVDHIEPESLHSFIHPELHDLPDLPAYIFIVPVQIRLGYVKKMQIILVEFLYILPGAPAELALPVCGRTAVWLPFFKKEKFFIVRISLHGFPEPFVAGGHMIKNHVEHHPDIAPPCLGDQLFHVFHSPVGRIDLIIIFHVIPVVVLRRDKERSKPDIIHAQLSEIIQLLDHSPEITCSVPVRIPEGLRIDLVNNTFSEILIHISSALSLI